MSENKKIIGIIGYGVVGKAAEATLSKSFKVLKYDKFTAHDTIESLCSANYVLITVPTPFDFKNNKVNDAAVVESLEALSKMKYNKIVIIKLIYDLIIFMT